MKPDPSIPQTWIGLLNEQTEWTALAEVNKWLSAMLLRDASADESALRFFWQTLTYIREVVYAVHFGNQPDTTVMNSRLEACKFVFYEEPLGQLPLLRDKTVDETDSALLISLANTYLLAFAQDLGRVFAGTGEFAVARCEGLYRDAKLQRLGAAPDIADEVELKWRREVEVLVEKGMDESAKFIDVQICFLETRVPGFVRIAAAPLLFN